MNTTTYEIIDAVSADGMPVRRVLIAGATYPLDCTVGGELLEHFSTRQRGHILDGSYGPVVQAYALACQETGVPCRLGWHGVCNALGDHAAVTPPTPIG